LGFAAGDGNFFRYVGNSPGNGLDPLGLQELPESDYSNWLKKRLGNAPWIYKPENENRDHGNQDWSNDLPLIMPPQNQENGNNNFLGNIPVPIPYQNYDGNFKWGIDWIIRTPIGGTGHSNTIPTNLINGNYRTYIDKLNQIIERGIGIGGNISDMYPPSVKIVPNQKGHGSIIGNIEYVSGNYRGNMNGGFKDGEFMGSGSFTHEGENGGTINFNGNFIMPVNQNKNGAVGGNIRIDLPVQGHIPGKIIIGGGANFYLPGNSIHKNTTKYNFYFGIEY